MSDEDCGSFSAFCKAASWSLTTLRKSHISDKMWSQYIFEMCEAFCEVEDHCVKHLVVCVGRQPESNVWVFGPDLQVDAKGREIQPKNYKYF